MIQSDQYLWKRVAQPPRSMLLFQVTGATTDLPHVLDVVNVRETDSKLVCLFALVKFD